MTGRPGALRPGPDRPGTQRSDAGPHDRLLLLVGLTGAGKSTVVDALAARRDDLRLLPNRREIADAIILPAVQLREGREVAPVGDRIERFRLTAAYRALHPGGMTHALEQWLAAHRAQLGEGLLLFDNLRGVDEVRAAAAAFPGARFLVLDAPPETRLARLVGRADPFDRVAVAAEGGGDAGDAARDRDGGNGAHEGNAGDAARDDNAGNVGAAAHPVAERLRAIDGVGGVLDPDALARTAAREGLDAGALVAAARILVEEQRHYDSGAAIAFLQSAVPPERLRVVDTRSAGPAEVAEGVLRWLEGDAPVAPRGSAP